MVAGPQVRPDGSIDSLHLDYAYDWELGVEKEFNAAEATTFYQQHWHYSIYLSMAYIVVIFGLQRYMRDRKPFDLSRSLTLWSAALAIFSIVAMIRKCEEGLYQLRVEPLWRTCCYSTKPQAPTGYWSHMFALSKVVELGDTLFIVLRKRPLIFLHYYHHITVMVYTWHALAEHTAAGRWFICVNLTVHAFMYTYYTLSSLKIRVPKIVRMGITLMQLSQMVVGVGICVIVYMAKARGDPCQMTTQNWILCASIYGSYFVLFANFFYQAYLAPKTEKITSNGVEKSEKTVVQNGANGDAPRSAKKVQ